MKADLNNQVALVTGAARSIGLATARLLAENGAQVIITDIDEAKVQATAAGLQGALAWRMDVSADTEVASAVGEISRRCGRIDILVNNAGINTMNHRVTIDQFPVAEWDRIMAVDLRGFFWSAAPWPQSWWPRVVAAS